MNKLNECIEPCKESKFVVYIDSLEKIWLIEELSLLLNTIKLLGYTTNQSRIVAENIINSNSKFKLFTGDKTSAFKVLDKLLEKRIQASIVKKTIDIFK